MLALRLGVLLGEAIKLLLERLDLRIFGTRLLSDRTCERGCRRRLLCELILENFSLRDEIVTLRTQ